MTYAICTQPPIPVTDTLPLFKITDYPLAEKDYKPFAQARLCITPEYFFVELWAFERLPQKESSLKAVFMDKCGKTKLFMECFSDGTSCCSIIKDDETIPAEYLSRPMSGDDLQGFYWGREFKIPLNILYEHFGRDAFNVGETLLGNCYKISESPIKPHKGSLYPADFKNGNEYALSSMAEFKIIKF